MIAEASGAILSNSSRFLLDAGHMLTDDVQRSRYSLLAVRLRRAGNCAKKVRLLQTLDYGRTANGVHSALPRLLVCYEAITVAATPRT